MASGAEIEAFGKLFASILPERADVDLASATLKRTKSLRVSISELSSSQAGRFSNPDTRLALSTLSTVADISNQNVQLLQGIGSDFQFNSLAGIALKYFDPPRALGRNVPGLDQTKWEQELFRLEPTAVLLNLVKSGVLQVPADARVATEALLLAAMEQHVDLSTQPLRELKTGDSSPKVPAVAIEAIHSIQRAQAMVFNPRHIGGLLAAGLDSAQAISTLQGEAFATRVVDHGILRDEALRIHDNAFTIVTRNQQTWVEMLQARTKDRLSAMRSKYSSSTQPVDESAERGANFTTLFGSPDDLGCENCESVLSPAAYLADLLETLKAFVIVQPSADARKVTLLDKLQERRSDILWLQLTCANTKTTLPYLDLANEVMEQYLAQKYPEALSNSTHDDAPPPSLEKLCAEAESRDPSLVEPSNMQLGIYRNLIQPTVGPLHQFPYNYGLDFVRTGLKALGISFNDLLAEFVSAERLIRDMMPQGPTPYSSSLTRAAEASLRRTRTAQILGLDEQDYICITHENFVPIEVIRAAGSDHGALSIEVYRTNVAGYTSSAKYWGYSSDQAMLNMSKGGLSFIKSQLLPRCGLEYDELVDVLRTSFMRARAIITSHDGCSLIVQDLDTMRLRSSMVVSADGKLTEPICDDLQTFIRLRNRLGWDTSTLDAAIYALSQSKPSSFTGIDPHIIDGLADFVLLSDLTGAPIAELCPLFATIDSHGPQSLYMKLCRRSRLAEDLVDSVKTPGRETATASSKDGLLSSKYQAVASALSLSVADLQVIVKYCGWNEKRLLNMETLSAIYRVRKMCDLLSITVAQYAAFATVFNIDPIGGATFSSPGYVLSLLQQWKLFQDNGWSMDTLTSVLQSEQTPATPSTTSPDGTRETTRSLVASLQNVLSQWPEVGDDAVLTEADVTAAATALVETGRASEVVAYIEGRHISQETLDASKTKVQRIPDDLREVLYMIQDRAAGTIQIRVQGLPDRQTWMKIEGLEKDVTLAKSAWQPLIKRLQAQALSPCQYINVTVFGRPSATAEVDKLASANVNDRRHEFVVLARRCIRRQQLQSTVVNVLQQTCRGLDAVSVTSLLSDKIQNSETELNKMVGALAALGTIPSPEDYANPSLEADVARIVDSMRRINDITVHFRISLAELRSLIAVEDLSVSMTTTLLSYPFTVRTLTTLIHYQHLQTSLSPPYRANLKSLIVPQILAEQVSAAKAIADATGWSEALLERILAAIYPVRSKQDLFASTHNVRALVSLQKMVDFCTKLDLAEVQIDLVVGWLNSIGDPDAAFGLAAAIRKTLELRHKRSSVSNSLSTAENSMNQLKERRRTALINYMLRDEDLTDLHIVSADDLYDYFLIDVKMGAETLTSRIRQAISTVQLFVQRCFLGIEQRYGVTPDSVQALKPRWDSIGRYTLWEAQRRVFLFPENWIDPTLRDTKTEPFKALEAAILQGDLTDEFLSNTIRNYVYAVQNIAHLDVQAYLWDRGKDDNARFHFFARTRTEPRQYYYRRLDLELFGKGNRLSYWHPWTAIDIGTPPQAMDRDGATNSQPEQYLIPALVRGRILLFAPEITLKTKVASAGSTKTVKEQWESPIEELASTANSWEIKMSWIELRNDKWSPRVVSPSVLKVEATATEPLPASSSFRFRVRARSPQNMSTEKRATFENGVEGVLVIDVECWREVDKDGNAIVPTAAAATATETTKATDDTKTADVKKKYIVPLRLGQFELRGTQLYLSDSLKTVFDSSLFPTTVPTHYSKLYWTVTDEKGGRLPSYELGNHLSKAGDRQSLMHQPLLIDYPLDEKRDLCWTLSFDDSQATRPIGLVVDVKTASTGAQTFFARPRAAATSIDPDNITTLDTFPFHHSFSNDLLEAAITGSLEKIYQTMGSKTGGEDGFGYLPGKIYHELFDSYSVYNWELGVHVVSLLMERLLATQQFDQAIRIAQLLFDPAKNPTNPSDCWSFPPFADNSAMRGQTVQALLTALSRKESSFAYSDICIKQWKRQPFNAHGIARSRPTAYMRRVVQKFVEILIAAGDSHFRQASLETIPMAIERYLEASHLLGPRPTKIKSMRKQVPMTFSALNEKFDSFANAAVDMELQFPYSCLQRGQAVGESTTDTNMSSKGLLGFLATTYFCIPSNPKLVEMWDLLDDRLSKIRNGQDINGMAFRPPLFDPPIDPGLLVSAAAAGGMGSASALAELDSPLPNYRFVYLIQKATEAASHLASLTDMFLSAREKRDSEALAQLKSTQDTVMQTMLLDQKMLQKEEAEKSIVALEDVRHSHESRLTYYLRLMGEPTSLVPTVDSEWTDLEQTISKPSKDGLRMSKEEKLEFDKSDEAAGLSFASTIMDTTASTLLALPNLLTQTQPMGVGVSVKMDAENAAKFMGGMSTVMRIRAQMCEMEGARAGRRNALIKQLQERRLQANQAARDIKQMDRQIDAARVRVGMADADMRAQNETIKQVAATEAWYKSKYTSEALYAWMENTTRMLCTDAYALTIDVARKAERAFQFERGLPGSSRFISPRGYWNNGHDGLLGAQSLLLDIRRMESAYMASSVSDFDLTKQISLRQISPLALVNLRMTGVAIFSLPESLFDFDFPGHYFRRIASVAVTIPCVTGPYTSINSTLSLLEHSYRVSPLAGKDGYLKQDSDQRFRTDRVPVSSIALGQANADSGVFELNFSRERYLPFENAGAISTWKLELPTHVRQFAYETISDVVLQLKYTSRQGGAQLRSAAEKSVTDLIKAAEVTSQGDGLFALLDLPNDFSNAWAMAKRVPSAGPKPSAMIALGDLSVMLPYWTRGRSITVQSVTLVARCSPADASGITITLLWGSNSEQSFESSDSGDDKWMVREIPSCGAKLSNWRLRIDGDKFATSVENMYILLRYSA